MLRTLGLIGFFALGGIAAGATRQLLLGNAERGREVFRSQGCVNCHNVNGDGGPGPDLARMVEPGFTPDRMAAILWNRSPAMWKKFGETSATRTRLTGQQAADLFIFFFSQRNFEDPGDARRGKRVFHASQCDKCHGIDDSPEPTAPPVRNWQTLDHPILLAQRMWSHPRQNKPPASLVTGTAFPTRSAQELIDMLVYLRAAADRSNPETFLPASPEEGADLFVSKGCVTCHQGSESLEGRPTRYTLNDFCASLWNHPRVVPRYATPLSKEEVRRLAGYLISTQFIEEHGDPKHGQQLFEKKRCAACHENPASPAPQRSSMVGRMTSFDMVAAIWNHGPAMSEATHTFGISWPQFAGEEMADLTAYLHGNEFKRRPPPGH